MSSFLLDGCCLLPMPLPVCSSPHVPWTCRVGLALRLDSQMATPRSNPTPEEQKWLDKQIQEATDAEMLDDARQAGTALSH